jgi:aminopeptidase N
MTARSLYLSGTSLLLGLGMGVVMGVGMVSSSLAQNVAIEAGVSQDLAMARRAILSDINYRLRFDIPAEESEAIAASATISFNLRSANAPLQLDFRESADKLHSVITNGSESDYRFEQEHLIIPANELQSGRNSIEIDFTAGDSSLNRNPEFLYTLFVPDRARTAFPLFDQPDLKATWELSLEIPGHWQAIANAPLVDEQPGAGGERKTLQFARSDLISSYLFSFVAGEFEKVTREINGREISLLHRESDEEKVARNLDAAFELHGAALNFLEDYTGIAYPFQKFDFALIPGFQYGGMEHVGAIQYRADSIFLDESPSQSQLLSRASLIAHETAHMWFGDLVTMQWFNDVWMKEVFANFIAAKAVNPSFPDINHELGFLLRHYPSAYAVDRTEGANPIRQNLPNLNEAGTLYGNIIYNKAPVMMRQLEALVGEAPFREGLRDYLSQYANGNASWPDLIEILDGKSEEDLQQWSQVWVNTPGRPHVQVHAFPSGTTLSVVQQDLAGASRVWPQRFSISFREGEGANQQSNSSNAYSLQTATIAQTAPGELSIINADGFGYGLFPANPESLQRWQGLSEVERGSLLIALYENMLEGEVISPQQYASELLNIATGEDNQLLLNRALGYMTNIYWSFLSESQRQALTPAMEEQLWLAMQAAEDSSKKKLYFDAWANIALSEEALNRLQAVWSENAIIEGLNLSETDYIDLASNLAIKRPNQAEAISNQQLERIENPDRKRRFEFVMPALSSDQAERDKFFESLKDEANRAREPWVLDGLNALHHPLRTAQSEKYLPASLELLQEIQQTGDIFFPARWLGASLGNYRSESAVKTVRGFLSERPEYNAQLRMKILQAADQLFRAERIASTGQ